MFLENVIFSLNEAFRTYDPVYVRKKTALISPNAYCMYTRTSMHCCIHSNRDRLNFKNEDSDYFCDSLDYSGSSSFIKSKSILLKLMPYLFFNSYNRIFLFHRLLHQK